MIFLSNGSKRTSTVFSLASCAANSVLSARSTSVILRGFSRAIFFAIGSPTPPTPSKMTDASSNTPTSSLYHSTKAVELRSYGSRSPLSPLIRVSTFASVLGSPKYSPLSTGLLLCGWVMFTAGISSRFCTKSKKACSSLRSPLIDIYRHVQKTGKYLVHINPTSRHTPAFDIFFGNIWAKCKIRILLNKCTKPLDTFSNRNFIV